MRSQDEGRTTVAEVARRVACSPSHLRAVFRKLTGRGVLPHLCGIRMEKAKRLLRETSLNISEIAYAVGFESPSNFARQFRRWIGVSPRIFRRSLARELHSANPPISEKEFRLVLHDEFAGTRPAAWWSPSGGTWEQNDGCLRGTGEDWFGVRLATLLPENFSVEFRACVSHGREFIFALILQDKENTQPFYQIMLPSTTSSPAIFRREHRDHLSSHDGIFKPGCWHALQLEISDNHVFLRLNRVAVFKFRDIFPPAYSRRCRLSLMLSAGVLSLRDFRLFDLGFPQVVPAVRQGDALFNSGLFEQARIFYERYRTSNLPPEDEIEVRYKIGMCLLRQGRLDSCRDTMLTLLQQTNDPFWRRECELVILRIAAEAGDAQSFLRHARRLMRAVDLRDGMRPILAGYYQNLRRRGFLQDALRVANLWARMDRHDPNAMPRAKDKRANILKNIGRLSEAEREYRLLSGVSFHESVRCDALFSLTDIRLLQRKPAEARKFLTRIRVLAANHPGILCECDVKEAVCLRAEGKFAEAISRFLSIRTRYPTLNLAWFPAEKLAAELLYCRGEDEHAAQLVARLRKEVPDQEILPFLESFIRKDYAYLATNLLRASRKHDEDLARHGQEAVTAGILFELGGDKKAANRAWGEAARRFPPDRCYFWGQLAEALATGQADGLSQAQLFWWVRAEMLYLIGCLYEHRGQISRAKRLFALTLKEDPTFRWPSLLALRKLGGSVREKETV
ncbi:MAG: helix-turn-helix transcriptional regulator [Kiritimatiellae bacterium]|nr:helix-turn-helix transcriptional regulator [Kiritimatiellia bacterium]